MSRLFSGTPFDRPPNCLTCGKPPAECRCLNLPEKSRPRCNKENAPRRLDSGLVLTPKNSAPPPDQVAKIRVEKRKANRKATVISGLDHPANDLPALCTHLKQSLGTGGSVQGRTIELQGEHAEKVAALLGQKNFNYRVV